MNRKKKSKIISTLAINCFIIGLSFGKIRAQTSLTLKDALTYALENKADAKKAKLEVENSRYKVQEARAGALPQVSLTGSITDNVILQKVAIPGELFGQPGTTELVAFGVRWNTLAGVSVNQTLFDQSVFVGLKAARTTHEFYQINEQLTEEQLIERVASNYYQVFVQRQKLIVLDSSYINTNKVKDIILGQYENGLAKKIDLDRIMVKISNINASRQQLSSQIELQENALKFYIGMPIETKIVIPQAEFKVPELLISQGQNTNVTERTEYLLLKKQEQLLVYQKKAYEAAYYPILSLFGNFNYQGLGDHLPIGEYGDGATNWSNFAAIGLNLKIPVFTGFRSRARVKQADINLRTLEQDITDMELSLDLEFENARTQINNSIITIKNQVDNIQLAQEVLSNTENNYTHGLASLTDLLDAENSFIEAQNNYTTALMEYKLAEIKLIKTQGTLKSLLN